jgi:hypothetical protein
LDAAEIMGETEMSYTFIGFKDAHKLMDELQANLDASHNELMKNSC